MSKSVDSKQNASEQMQEEYNNVKRDSKLMAKLKDLKLQIDLLQKELNYELQQLELVKKQSVSEYAPIPLNYSNLDFGQSNPYASHPLAPDWYPNKYNSYYQCNPYTFGYANRSEAHAAFSNSLKEVNQTCSSEIKNRAQDISKLRTIRRKWTHYEQPFNNLGSPAGDDLKEVNSLNLTTIHPPKDTSYRYEYQNLQQREDRWDLEKKPAYAFASKNDLNVIEGANVKRVRREPNHSPY